MRYRVSGFREQGTGSREQGIWNLESGIGNRDHSSVKLRSNLDFS
ncbi:hypothetical protein [Moorena sp. SIO1F2]|nr:hypothetical protein [Moorena sp. SIO1F2]